MGARRPARLEEWMDTIGECTAIGLRKVEVVEGKDACPQTRVSARGLDQTTEGRLASTLPARQSDAPRRRVAPRIGEKRSQLSIVTGRSGVEPRKAIACFLFNIDSGEVC